MAAANLQAAAAAAYTNLDTQWVAGTLKTALTTFWQSIDATFPDQSPNNQPIGNWIALIAAVAYECPATPPFGVGNPKDQWTFFNTAAQYVYRICWLGDYLDGQGLISSAQATALLAAFNACFP